MIHVLTVIAPLFLIIFASALLRKFGNVGSEWSKALNEFALKVGLPALVFSSLLKASFSIKLEASLIVVNSLFILFSFFLIVVIRKVFRIEKKMFLTLFICFVFHNIAYLGIPFLTSVFGDRIVPQASLITAIYLFWVFTIGVGVLDYYSNENKQDVIKDVFKNLVRNPLLIAVALSLFIVAFNIPIPAIVLKSLDMVSSSVTPIVLVVIGLFLGGSEIGKMSQWWPALLFSLLILWVAPSIFYFALKLFGFNPLNFSASIIEAATPLAITPFALSGKYGLDRDFIARSIILSTVLSVVSLSFWVSFLR